MKQRGCNFVFIYTNRTRSITVAYIIFPLQGSAPRNANEANSSYINAPRFRAIRVAHLLLFNVLCCMVSFPYLDVILRL